MAVIVKKYGGASIETIELIDSLAAKLAKDKKKGDDIVVVVSAMAKTTDYLFSLAGQISSTPYQRELDMLVTAGERISMALLSIALHKYGLPAISFTGSQSGIITNNYHGNARIVDVNAFRIKDELSKGKIVIVAGYQGVSTGKEITTLGRGGSDTTAVALAAYLNADKCEMYKDVEGIFSADPKRVETAEKIDALDYRSMLSLCYCGCKAVHPRAVEFAMKHNVPLEIKSAFKMSKGTMIAEREGKMRSYDPVKERNMEEKRIMAITAKDELALLEIQSSDIAFTINVLNELNPEVDALELSQTDKLRLTVPYKTKAIIEQKISLHNRIKILTVSQVSTLSLIGYNLSDLDEIYTEMIKMLDAQNAEIVWMKTDASCITFYLKTGNITDLERLFHDRFINSKKIKNNTLL